MNCTNCQKVIPDDADFCKYCGAPAPFTSGVNYHPETLFANEIASGGTSSSSSGSVEKAMTEMEARLSDKLSGLTLNRKSKRLLWSRIQTIAALLIVISMAVGVFLLSQLITKMDEVNVKLENAATVSSEMKTSLEGLAQIQEMQDSMQAELSKLLEAQQADDSEQDKSPSSLVFQVVLYLNYEEDGVVKNLNSVMMKPGDVLSLAAQPVPEREGYELTGWSTEKNGSGNMFAQDAVIGYFGYDIELYAQWKMIDPAPEATSAPVG